MGSGAVTVSPNRLGWMVSFTGKTQRSWEPRMARITRMGDGSATRSDRWSRFLFSAFIRVIRAIRGLSSLFQSRISRIYGHYTIRLVCPTISVVAQKTALAWFCQKGQGRGHAHLHLGRRAER